MSDNIESSGEFGGMRQADAIRAFVIETYVEPARSKGLSSLKIRAGDVHKAMALQNAVPAVCSVLSGNSLQKQAGLALTDRIGPEVSTTTEYTYHLSVSDMDSMTALKILEDRVVADELSHYSDRGRTTKAIIYQTSNGRKLGLELGNGTLRVSDLSEGKFRYDPPADISSFAKRTLLVFERSPQGQQLNWHDAELIPGVILRDDQLGSSAYNLAGAGLKMGHQQLAVVESPTALSRLLDWYQAEGRINRRALERMRKAFLGKYGDFEPACFASQEGQFFEDERREKNEVLEKFASLLDGSGSIGPGDLGGDLLDALIEDAPSLFDWRSRARYRTLREAHPGVLERATEEMVRSTEPIPAAIASWVEKCWPILAEGQKSRPFADSRNLPTMIMAFARPIEAIEVNTQPLYAASISLLGESLWGNNPLEADEYARVIDLAKSLFRVMREEWHWQPQDLWDVQGFIWQVGELGGETEAESQQDFKESTAMSEPINRILYGPPGTGKTYLTAAQAVQLCDGLVPTKHAELKARYDSLMDAGQIAFVTFHQSYAYEDFVEGLRPETGDPAAEGEQSSTSGGFRLEPRDGIFREICALAEQARKSGKRGKGLDLSGRQFFKMSLGRAGEEDFIYDAAIEGGYIVLGYGGEIDWSDPKYEEYQAIFDKWNEIEPGTSGNSGNIAQVYCLRGWMNEGDIVIASEGNLKFRAIGEIVGPYEYNPTGIRTYSHRRSVKWHLVLDEALPVETILNGQFSQASCYNLKVSKLKLEAISRLLANAGEEEAEISEPDQFVLIIDEINRANISKVFGELITLIEPDKRLGRDNAIKVKLPYSGDTFGVPDNLHIIGTMNTADRSIALLDTALRRRFQFTELMPQPELLGVDVEGINLQQLLTTLNARIEYLFDRDHQIGHAYFMDCDSKDAVDRAMRNKVIPLLVEYFYEDWERVRQVLGETQNDGAFIVRTKLAPPPGSDGDFADDRYRYTVRDSFAATAHQQLTA